VSFDENAFLTLVARVQRGELTIDQGERAAAEPDVVGSLSPPLVGGVSEASSSTAGDGRWFEAQLVQRLLVAATEQLRDEAGVSDAYSMRTVAATDWVEIAHLALLWMPSPDGRLLAAGRSRGERALERALQIPHPGVASTLDFRLGTLHLDPYKARPSPLTGPRGEEAPWEATFVGQLGEAVLGVGRDSWPMPAPIDALRYAAEHLRAALGGEVRHDGAAKALAQTLDTLMSLGEAVDPDELLSACRVALDALDPDADTQVFEEVSEILARRS
jgi:hypothetical protein